MRTPVYRKLCQLEGKYAYTNDVYTLRNLTWHWINVFYREGRPSKGLIQHRIKPATARVLEQFDLLFIDIFHGSRFWAVLTRGINDLNRVKEQLDTQSYDIAHLQFEEQCSLLKDDPKSWFAFSGLPPIRLGYMFDAKPADSITMSVVKEIKDILIFIDLKIKCQIDYNHRFDIPLIPNDMYRLAWRNYKAYKALLDKYGIKFGVRR
jgi:hypothetical protein